MTGIELFNVADRIVAQVSSAQSRKRMLEGMVLNEMKYNLDVFSAFNLTGINRDRASAKELIGLLSNTALERLLTFAPSASDLSGFALFTSPVLKTAKKLFTADSGEIIREDESVLQISYKRIAVLKALVSVSENNSAIRKINYSLRLNNLRDIFLKIVQNTKA